MSGNTPTSMKILMEGWRSFVESPKALSEKYLDQGITVGDPPLDPLASPEKVPAALEAPIDPKKSAIIGSLRGTGQKPKLDKAGNIKRRPLPFGLFINGEHLGEDPRWILGANMQGNRKKNHYGTNELIKVVKAGIDNVHAFDQDYYDKRWLQHILGDDFDTDKDQSFIKFLKDQNIIPRLTDPLYIEDLGLAPYFTDIYGNTYHGGHKMRGHGSHQTGQDADLGFYMMPGYEMVSGFREASGQRKLLKGFISRSELADLISKKTELKDVKKVTDTIQNLEHRLGTFDAERTWKLISGMASTGLVEMIFVDRSLHEDLKAAATRAGEETSYKAAKILHQANHKNHIHVRVYAPDSKERGKPLARKLNRKFMKNPSTRSWLASTFSKRSKSASTSSKRSKSGLTSGEKLYPERDPYGDIVNSLSRRQ